MAAIEAVLFRLYRIPCARRLVANLARRLDRGTLELRLLRNIFSFYHDIEIGAYSYGGCFRATRVAPGTKIGKFCSFAQDVHIFAANHSMRAVTTHPFVYNPAIGVVDKDLREYHHVAIGNDVWMGQNSIITPSCSIVADGSVIGAGAVVTKDVPPYVVVGGVPARILKYRFPDDVIEALLRIKWWDWDPTLIFSMHAEFRNIDRFLAKVKEMGKDT